MKLSCIAVDDEKLALEFLADNIGRIPYLHLVATCKNAFEAGNALQNQQIDLVILDIQMPGLNGLEFIKRQNPRPLVIFVTAYDLYAVDAFTVEAIDYLVKPVAFERFLQAVNKAFLFSNHTRYIAGNVQPDPEFLFFSVNYSLVKVLLADILYVEGLNDYMRIHLLSSRQALITRLTMKALLDLLPDRKFLRIHRSYIVAVSAIAVIKKDSLLLIDSRRELPISAGYRENLDSIIGKK